MSAASRRFNLLAFVASLALAGKAPAAAPLLTLESFEGGCWPCVCWPENEAEKTVILCEGPHITYFPSMSEEWSNHVRQIHVYQTNIACLPDLSSGMYSSLQKFHEQENARWDCDCMEIWVGTLSWVSFYTTCPARTTDEDLTLATTSPEALATTTINDKPDITPPAPSSSSSPSPSPLAPTSTPPGTTSAVPNSPAEISPTWGEGSEGGGGDGEGGTAPAAAAAAARYSGVLMGVSALALLLAAASAATTFARRPDRGRASRRSCLPCRRGRSPRVACCCAERGVAASSAQAHGVTSLELSTVRLADCFETDESDV